VGKIPGHSLSRILQGNASYVSRVVWSLVMIYANLLLSLTTKNLKICQHAFNEVTSLQKYITTISTHVFWAT